VRRWISRLISLRLLGTALLSAVLVVVIAPSATAHPLGNFTVNSYSGLTVEPTAVAVQLVVDTAEIPTLQAFPQVNGGHPISTSLQDAYRIRQCQLLAKGAQLTVAGAEVPVAVVDSTLSFPPGSAGLHIMRLTCDTRTTRPVDTVGRSVLYRDVNSLDRVGWHEITAVGDGVRLSQSDVPAVSPSHVLTAYPVDLLSSPLNQRSADLAIVTGSGVVAGTAVHVQDPSTAMPRGVDRLTTAFTSLVASRNLTIGFALVAVLLAVVLGGMHAFAPGHGKTLMAAYLIGRRSSLRQAAIIGLSVTLTHTVGVLALGIVLSLVAFTAPERVYPWLGLASGVMLVSIGITLLRNGLATRRQNLAQIAETALAATAPPVVRAPRVTAVTSRRAQPMVSAFGHRQSSTRIGQLSGKTLTQRGDPAHNHESSSAPDHGHGADHHDGSENIHAAADTTGMHSHGLFSHTHLPPAGSERTGARSLLAVGFAGGLVPSPSALVVLLGGIALGRAWFGVLLVIAYGIGMALALIGTGLVLVKARDRLHRWAEANNRTRRTGAVLIITRALPSLTAVIVVGAGISVAVRAIASM